MVNVTIHATGMGTDSLTGKKDIDGLNVSFEDGSVQHLFLSWKSFRQLLNLKTQGQNDPSNSPQNGNGMANSEQSALMEEAQLAEPLSE